MHCEREGTPEGENARPLVAAALALPIHLMGYVDDLAAENPIIDAGPMGEDLVANQMVNNSPHWRTAWAVHRRCLRELLARAPELLGGCRDGLA